MKAICSKCGLDWEVSESVTLRKGKYICPYCKRKERIRNTVIFFAGFIISILLVLGCKDLAYEQRGYNANGGEVLIPILYLAVIALIKEIGGMIHGEF